VLNKISILKQIIRDVEEGKACNKMLVFVEGSYARVFYSVLLSQLVMADALY